MKIHEQYSLENVICTDIDYGGINQVVCILHFALKIGSISKHRDMSKIMARMSHPTTGKNLNAKFVNKATPIFSKRETIFLN